MAQRAPLQESSRGNDPSVEPQMSLQDSFQAFRAKRASQMSRRKARSEQARARTDSRRRTDPTFRNELREKFVARARHYFGVPYSSRAVEQMCAEEDPDRQAPLYLDCCGLVRQVLRDLADDFGFVVGPWNQAYLFETLPVRFESVDELKPGDLIFTSAPYYSDKRKRQRHDMVHVEIFVGGASGRGTIGSRKLQRIPNPAYPASDSEYEWTGDAQRVGHVGEHPTYMFRSLSYGGPTKKFWFCSLQPWLDGVLRPTTEWVGRVNGVWVRESGAGRVQTKQAEKSVFGSGDCAADDDGADADAQQG
jgi:hypothetical protein